MNGRRRSVVYLCGLPLLLIAGCSASSSPVQPVASGLSPPPPSAQPPLVLFSSTPLTLSGGCAIEAVTQRLAALARDVSRGDGVAVAAHFLAGPDLRWEVREHFDPPNGTGGALRTLDAISAFAEVMHKRGEIWKIEQVVPPAERTDGTPAVFGGRVTASASGTTLGSPVKVIIDCATGRVSHMVGPST